MPVERVQVFVCGRGQSEHRVTVLDKFAATWVELGWTALGRRDGGKTELEWRRTGEPQRPRTRPW